MLDTAEASYKNINAEKLWNAPKATIPAEKKDEATKENTKIVALTAKLEQLVKKGPNDNPGSSKQDSSWRYQNLEGKAICDTMARDEKTY